MSAAIKRPIRIPKGWARLERGEIRGSDKFRTITGKWIYWENDASGARAETCMLTCIRKIEPGKERAERIEGCAIKSPTMGWEFIEKPARHRWETPATLVLQPK